MKRELAMDGVPELIGGLLLLLLLILRIIRQRRRKILGGYRLSTPAE
jgi:hypothetical protein